MRWDGEEGTSERSYLIPLGPSVCRLASSFFLHLPPPGGPDDRRDREGGGKSRERDRKERRVKWRDRSCSALYLVILSSPFTFLARRARFGSDETMTRRKRNEKSRGRDEMSGRVAWGAAGFLSRRKTHDGTVVTVRNGRTEWGCEWQEPSDRDERDSLGSSLPLPYRPEGPWPDGMRRGWTEWMTRGYGPPYCFRSLHGSCLSSPFSHVIPLASLRSCSVPFRSERGEGWKTEPSDENGKGSDTPERRDGGNEWKAVTSLARFRRQGRRRAVMGRKNDGPFLTPLITPAARRRRVNGVSGADGGGAPGDGPAVHERNEEAGRSLPYGRRVRLWDGGETRGEDERRTRRSDKVTKEKFQLSHR